MRGERDVVGEGGVQGGAVRDGDEDGDGWGAEGRGGGGGGEGRGAGRVGEEVERGGREELVGGLGVAEVAEENRGRDAEVVADVPPEREVCAGLCGGGREAEAVEGPYGDGRERGEPVDVVSAQVSPVDRMGWLTSRPCLLGLWVHRVEGCLLSTSVLLPASGLCHAIVVPSQ